MSSREKLLSSSVGQKHSCIRMFKIFRLSFIVKFVILALILWCSFYVIMSKYRSELLKDIKAEDLNIKNLQEKLSNLIAQQFNQEDIHNDFFDEGQEIDKKEADDKTVTTIELDDGITTEARNYIRASRRSHVIKSL